MFAGLIVVPSAPLLIPELVGPRAQSAVDVRAAVLAAGTHLAERATAWIAVGSGPEPESAPQNSSEVPRTGSFARYGVDVPVTLDGEVGDGADTAAADEVLPDEVQRKRAHSLPLSMLIAGWLRGAVGAGSVTPVILDPAATSAYCLDVGNRLRAEIDAELTPVGVVVVGDGCISLSGTSPGGGRSKSAIALQERIDAALATADRAALADLDAAACARQGVDGRAPWQVGASLLGQTGVATEPLYSAAPFGVGYSVVEWWPR